MLPVEKVRENLAVEKKGPSSLTPFEKDMLEKTISKYDKALHTLSKS